MILYLRLLEVLIRCWMSPRVGPLEISRLPMWVRPWDCDANLHMNNGRFMTVMDLGRLHLMGRAKVFGLLLRRRWFPVVSAADIRFMRPLRPFERYTLETEVLAWDDRWFYMEQRFITGRGIVAQGRIKGGFFHEGRSVAPIELLRVAGIERPSPLLPEAFARWAALHTGRSATRG